MPLTLRDLAPFLTPYTSPNERVETTSRALAGLNDINRTSIMARRNAQDAAHDAARLAQDKAEADAALKHNQAQLTEQQRYHTAEIEHDKKTLEENRFKSGMELYGSLQTDIEEGREPDPVKLHALGRYGFGFVPDAPPQPPPPPAPLALSPEMARAMPHVAGLLGSPAHQRPQQQQPQQQQPAPSPMQALPAPQGQPAPGSAPQQPQPQQPQPQMQAPGPPQAEQPQLPKRWIQTFDGRPVGIFDPAQRAAQAKARSEAAIAPLLAAQSPEDQVFAKGLMSAAAASGMPLEKAVTWVEAGLRERAKLAAELAQDKAQAAAAEQRNKLAEARQTFAEQRSRAEYQLSVRRLELQQLRDQTQDKNAQKRIDQQIKREERLADQRAASTGAQLVKGLMKGRGAEKTASSIGLLNHAIREYEAHPNEPKYWKAAAYAIAKARDEGKLSDADVLAVPEITGWLAKTKQWAAANFEGETSEAEYQALGEMLKTMRDTVVLHSHEHYQELATLRDSELEGSPAHRAIDKILMGVYVGAPWWKAERESEGLKEHVEPEPKQEEEPEEEEPDFYRNLEPLPETIPTGSAPLDEERFVGPPDENAVVPRAGEPADPPPVDINGILDAAATEHGLPPELLRAVAKQESNGNPKAVSPVGAQGLLQLMPGTAKDLGVTEPFDATRNAYGGAQYLAEMIKKYGVEKGLQAYNGGPGRMAKSNATGEPMPEESQNYSRSILGRLGATVPAKEAAPTPEQRQAFRRWATEFKAKNGRAPTKAELDAHFGEGG